MYPFPSSVATNRHGKPTASVSSDEELIHTNYKHHLKKNRQAPSKSMPSEARPESKWTIRAIYLIGFMVKDQSILLDLLMIDTGKVMHSHFLPVDNMYRLIKPRGPTLLEILYSILGVSGPLDQTYQR